MAMAHSLGHARAAGGIAAAAAATVAGGARAWAPVAAAAATTTAGVRSNGGTALCTQGGAFDSIPRRSLHCSAATGAAAATAASASVARTPRRVARAQGAAARSGGGTPSSSSSHTPPPSTFSALGLPFSVVSAAATVGATVPTPIQSLAIPALLAGRTALLASHTGSGKTLAYLLPIIAQMNRDESERGVRTRLNRPRAIIVVPNRELAVQVLGVAKELSHLGRFRSYASTGFIPLRKLTRALQDPLDLLVVTPGRLEFLLSSQRISLSDTRYVVTDESDTLLSEEHGFADSVQRVLFKPMQERARAREEAAKEAARVARASGIVPATNTPVPAPGVQFVFCSASITPAVENALSRSFPDLVRLHTPSLHHVPENLVMRSIPVRNQDKAELLWELLQHESDSYRRRLMHHRTRAQNKEDIARLGGERQLLEHLVEQDCGERGLPLAAVKASEAAELAEQQQEQEEDEQSEQDLTEDPDAREAHRQPHPEDARLPAVNKRSSTTIPVATSSSSATPEVYLPLPPTIIFCNTVSCCRAIAWSLTARGLHVAHYHGLMPAHYRTEHLRSFISGATNILVATDLASRGLDTTFVRHVVHFDFPFHVLDFVHRVGRTARNGQKGKSTALVEKKDRVLADAIERLTSRGLSIEQLTGDKSRYGPDGMPVSAAVAAAERARAEARQNSAQTASANAAGTSVSADGVKQLGPARRAPKPASLRPGEQPRRRWMRYMRPSVRNEHKLLYANRPELMPSGLAQQELREKTLQSARKVRRSDDTPATMNADSGAPSNTHDPAHDPFAFSSPYGRHRNAATPAMAAKGAAAAQQQQQPAHVVEAQRRAAAVQAASAAAARSASGRPASSPFPLAQGLSRRPGLARPLGPLAHKQRVGSIFAASTAKPGQAPPGQTRHQDPPEEARFDKQRFRPSSSAAGGRGGRSGMRGNTAASARQTSFNHEGRSATSGAARRREAVARALEQGEVVGRKRPGVPQRRAPTTEHKGPNTWKGKPRKQ